MLNSYVQCVVLEFIGELRLIKVIHYRLCIMYYIASEIATKSSPMQSLSSLTDHCDQTLHAITAAFYTIVFITP